MIVLSMGVSDSGDYASQNLTSRIVHEYNPETSHVNVISDMLTFSLVE